MKAVDKVKIRDQAKQNKVLAKKRAKKDKISFEAALPIVEKEEKEKEEKEQAERTKVKNDIRDKRELQYQDDILKA